MYAKRFMGWIQKYTYNLMYVRRRVMGQYERTSELFYKL
jgi:hypothetical protein